MRYSPLVVLAVLAAAARTFAAAEQASVHYSGDDMQAVFSEKGDITAVVLSGNVRIVYEDLAISCERAELDRAAGTVVAKGGISLKGPFGEFFADEMTYNIITDSGTLLRGRFGAPPFYGKAGRIVRRDGVFRLEDGYVTTCDRDPPHYRASCRTIEYVPEKHIRAEGVKTILGRRFAVFYFPRFTYNLKTQEPAFVVAPGYRTRLGRTLGISWNNLLGTDPGVSSTERIELGGKGIGAGWDVSPVGDREDSTGVRTLVYKEWDEDPLRGGAYGWHSSGRENRFGYGSAIVDWRWMYDSDFFNDYFRKEYVERSKMYNYVAFAERFAAGTLSLTVREDARESTLTVEKLPEVRFYTPARLIGSSTVLGNDLAATHFRTPAGEYVRAAETLTLERKWAMGPLAVRPYAALSAVAYRGTGDDLLSFPEEAGIEFSALWERRDDGGTSGHLIPFVSLVGRSANLKPVDLPALDRRERFLNGRFLEAGGDWSFWRAGTMVGRVGLRNSYDIGRDSFADSSVVYGFSLAGRCRVAGENVWSFADGAYVFGANDFIWEGVRTRFSMGNRYARSDYSGFENWLEHDFGDGLRGRLGLLYDLKNEGAFSEHVQIWKRLHCWTVSFGLSRDDKDTSVSLAFAPGRLLDMDTWKGRFLKWR